MTDDTTPDRDEGSTETTGEQPEPANPPGDATNAGDFDDTSDEEIIALAHERYGDLDDPERSEMIIRDLGRAGMLPSFKLDPWVQNYFTHSVAPINRVMAERFKASIPEFTGIAGSLAKIQPTKNFLSYNAPRFSYNTPRLGTPYRTAEQPKPTDSQSRPDAPAEAGEPTQEEPEVDEKEVARIGKAAAVSAEKEFHRKLLDVSHEQNLNLVALLNQMSEQVSAAQQLGKQMQDQVDAVGEQTRAHEGEWQRQADRARWQAWLTIFTLAVATITLLVNMFSRPDITIEAPQQDRPTEPSVVESGSP